MTLRSVFFVVIGLCLNACHVGPQVEQLRTPLSPKGANIEIVLNSGNSSNRPTHQGELLDVRDTGLVVALHTGVHFFPWNTVFKATGTELKSLRTDLRDSKDLEHPSINELRLVSRFPQGLSIELQRALLAGLGQDEIIVMTLATE